jgi:hypothetical protein
VPRDVCRTTNLALGVYKSCTFVEGTSERRDRFDALAGPSLRKQWLDFEIRRYRVSYRSRVRPVQERVRKKFESRQATVMARRTLG